MNRYFCWYCKGHGKHTTENHMCRVCDQTGHSAKIHCRLCREIGHSIEDHCLRCKKIGHKESDHNCSFRQCKIYEDHTHPCEYCLEDHTTNEHKCWCGQYGHGSKDHKEKCYCINCEVIGHINSDLHYECKYCDFTIIFKEHFWCEACKSCNYKKHENFCEYCNGCMALDDVYGYDQDEGIRCTKCYRRPGDLEKHDVTKGVRIPRKPNNSEKIENPSI